MQPPHMGSLLAQRHSLACRALHRNSAAQQASLLARLCYGDSGRACGAWRCQAAAQPALQARQHCGAWRRVQHQLRLRCTAAVAETAGAPAPPLQKPAAERKCVCSEAHLLSSTRNTCGLSSAKGCIVPRTPCYLCFRRLFCLASVLYRPPSGAHSSGLCVRLLQTWNACVV